ncbi:MAG: acyl-CoA thioesterase [Thermoanaerobacteraceae bacterium]|jgi:lysophospholipase L1-like esterase|nr:acyl-CoA thioesterase [Thermoanaerobacteraceae bacterium]
MKYIGSGLHKCEILLCDGDYFGKEVRRLMKKNLKVVALGDSITQGYPFDMEASWVYILKMEKGLDIVNKGINGDTLEGMLERFERDVISLLPGMVIIMGGTNDAFDGYSLSSMEYNLKRMVKFAKESKIVPVIGIPVPVDEPAVEIKLQKFRDFLRNFCDEEKIAFIDFYKTMVDEYGKIKEKLDFDGVHPNRDGYRVMADIAYDFLIQAF